MQKRIIIIETGVSDLAVGIYTPKAGWETKNYNAYTMVTDELCIGWGCKGCCQKSSGR